MVASSVKGETMAETVDKVAERLASLEVTVAKGFHETSQHFEGVSSEFKSVSSEFKSVGSEFKSVHSEFKSVHSEFKSVHSEFKSVDQRFHEAELRDIALSRKIDVATETLRGDLRNVMDAVASLGEEMRRTTDSIRKEHAADRAVLTTAIESQARRLHTLEQKQ